MKTTKLGIPAGWLGVIFFLLCMFGGYTVAILFAGYILLMEENTWLKKTAVKGIGIMLVFSFLSLVLYLPINLMNLLDNMLNIFGTSLYVPIIQNIVSFFDSILALLEKAVFILLALFAIKEKTIKIPGFDALLDKYIG